MNQKQLFITLAILVMAIVFSGCVAAASSQAITGVSIPEITIKAADFSFDAPAQIEAGLVKINLVNNGQAPHHAQIIRLNDGVTLEQLQTALQEDPVAALSLAVAVGGPGVIDPGLSGQVTLELSPGHYVLLCFVPGHDGLPHLAKGMVRPIEVVAATGSDHASAPQPAANMVVKLRDFEFPLPSKIKAGPQVWQILNEGKQLHEIMLIKLAEGKRLEDVQAFMHSPDGAPPFANVGGFQAIHPGETGWLNLDLTPGEYVALCYVPDENGKAHIEHGMVQALSVK
jgi:uncharacterized cupredoxin-like copper-binding protein